MDLNKIKTDISKYGLSIIAFDATDYLPSFAHSIGLWEQYQHPEIILFGLPVGMMQSILNEIGERLKSGARINCHQLNDDFFENGKAIFLTVDISNVADYFGYAIKYYKEKSFDAIEMIWTDRNLKFPWEENFEVEYKFKQPLLDRNADFKFYEEKNLAVFTTKQFIDGRPILKVVHDSDGEWQFLTAEQQNEDARIVSLEEMILKDPSLNDLFDLDYGQEAERKSITEKWQRRLSS